MPSSQRSESPDPFHFEFDEVVVKGEAPKHPALGRQRINVAPSPSEADIEMTSAPALHEAQPAKGQPEKVTLEKGKKYIMVFDSDEEEANQAEATRNVLAIVRDSQEHANEPTSTRQLGVTPQPHLAESPRMTLEPRVTVEPNSHFEALFSLTPRSTTQDRVTSVPKSNRQREASQLEDNTEPNLTLKPFLTSQTKVTNQDEMDFEFDSSPDTDLAYERNVASEAETQRQLECVPQPDASPESEAVGEGEVTSRSTLAPASEPDDHLDFGADFDKPDFDMELDVTPESENPRQQEVVREPQEAPQSEDTRQSMTQHAAEGQMTHERGPSAAANVLAALRATAGTILDETMGGDALEEVALNETGLTVRRDASGVISHIVSTPFP